MAMRERLTVTSVFSSLGCAVPGVSVAVETNHTPTVACKVGPGVRVGCRVRRTCRHGAGLSGRGGGQRVDRRPVQTARCLMGSHRSPSPGHVLRSWCPPSPSAAAVRMHVRSVTETRTGKKEFCHTQGFTGNHGLVLRVFVTDRHQRIRVHLRQAGRRPKVVTRIGPGHSPAESLGPAWGELGGSSPGPGQAT